MKALTLHQPWASFIVHGFKRFETRSWPTDYRGLLIIHAGKAQTPEGREVWEEYGDCLDRYARFGALPFGAVVGIIRLVNCESTFEVRHREELRLSDLLSDYMGAWNQPMEAGQVEAAYLAAEDAWNREQDLGDFGPGRYAWELQSPWAMPVSIPCRGYQQLWDAPQHVWMDVKARMPKGWPND